MKMRQKLIAVLAASMVVTSVPVVTMADTTNYVSAARYAKKGTTYGYTVNGDKVVGASGLSKYTDFNGFEFAPIMNYTQPGTMFMSLTKDTNFDAQAILTYVDSFNASKSGAAAQTDLKVVDGKVYDANTEEFNGRLVEDIIEDGVTLNIISNSSTGQPAKITLDRATLRDKLEAEIRKNPSGYISRVSYVDVVNSIVNRVAEEIDEAITVAGGIDKVNITELMAKVETIVEEVVKEVENGLGDGGITTTQSFYLSQGGNLDEAAVAKFLTPLVQAEVKEFYTKAPSQTITIKKVESFTVKDADDREYNSHLRVDFEGTFYKNVTYRVPLLAKVGGDKVVLLNIDGRDSFVTSGKYNLTQDAVSDKRVTATADTAKIRTNYTEEIGKIKLTETAIDALQGDGTVNRQIKLELPSSSGLEFNLTKTKSNVKATGMRAFYGKEVKNDDLDAKYGEYERRGDKDQDRQTLIITLPNWTDDTAKGEIELTGIYVQPVDQSASIGEVNVTLSEYVATDKKSDSLVASTKLKVAEVKDYDVTLTCEKPVDIKAGRSGIINDKTVTFVLEEAVKDSLADGRKIGFELENGYIFGAADVTGLKDNYSTSDYKAAAEARFKKLVTDGIIKLKVNGSDKIDGKDVVLNTDDLKLTYDAEGRVTGFSTTYPQLSEEKADKIELTLPIATGLMSTGEVKVVATNLTTRSFQDKENPSAVVAKIINPIEVTFDGAKLKVGLQAQEAGSITIKETDKGMLDRGWLFLTADINSGITFDKVPTVTIQSADGKEVEITNVALNKAKTVLGLEIAKTSLDASTIKISDIVLTADRTVPEANYDLVMWGSALTDESVRDITSFSQSVVNNAAYFGEGSDIYRVKEFVQMTTKNTEDITDSNNKAVTASFVIGESKFKVNNEEVAMDSAAYVKNGYTFVPVKYVAKAFGIEGNAVQYDKATSTATIIAGNKVINITNGKPFIVVNGTQVPMAVKAEVKEGRMCVPMAYIAAALDVQKSWDATTKTATFTNVTEATAPAAEASTK